MKGSPELTSPITKEPCLAAGVELAVGHTFGRAVMLRDGITCGFDVALDDGRYLTSIDEARVDGAPKNEDPIPFDEASEVLLRAGDAVEIVGELTAVADPTRQGGYREAAMVLAPASCRACASRSKPAWLVR